jgi:small-conductance mechanosensitive channel
MVHGSLAEQDRIRRRALVQVTKGAHVHVHRCSRSPSDLGLAAIRRGSRNVHRPAQRGPGHCTGRRIHGPGRPFKVGDRIEIDGTAGDVIDIRAFRFTLLEIKNWVDADQATGRVVHVPNGKLFKSSAANYTEGFFHIWHEIPVLITFESDWNRAEEVLRETIAPLAIGEEELRYHQEIATAEHDYFIRFRELRPAVYVSTRDSGVLLTVRLLVEARQRRSVDDQFWRSTLAAFAAEPSVSLAYPTRRAYLDDPLVVHTEEVRPTTS